MKDTKTITLSSTLYTMLTDEAAKRCMRAGCSMPKAIDNILEAQRELMRRGFLPRKNFKV